MGRIVLTRATRINGKPQGAPFLCDFSIKPLQKVFFIEFRGDDCSIYDVVFGKQRVNKGKNVIIPWLFDVPSIADLFFCVNVDNGLLFYDISIQDKFFLTGCVDHTNNLRQRGCFRQ